MTIIPRSTERPLPVRPAHPGVFGFIAAILGILIAIWMTAGRVLFGVDGDMVRWFAYSLGPAYALLQIYIARNIILTARRGYRLRPAAIGTLAVSWGTGILFGLMVPDNTAAGMESILSVLAGPVAMEIGIGVSNPCGIISFALAIFALALSGLSARGPKPVIDEDAVEWDSPFPRRDAE